MMFNYNESVYLGNESDKNAKRIWELVKLSVCTFV